jgi:hypothetical protein
MRSKVAMSEQSQNAVNKELWSTIQRVDSLNHKQGTEIMRIQDQTQLVREQITGLAIKLEQSVKAMSETQEALLKNNQILFDEV